jgi:hypothetical protein
VSSAAKPASTVLPNGAVLLSAAPPAGPGDDTGLTMDEMRSLAMGATEGSIAAKRVAALEGARLAELDAAAGGSAAAKVAAAKAELRAAAPVAAAPKVADSYAREVLRLWLGALALAQYSEEMADAGFDSLARLAMLTAADVDAWRAPKALPVHKRQLLAAVEDLRKEIGR